MPSSIAFLHERPLNISFSYDAGVLGGVQTTKPFLDALGNPPGTLIIPLIASSYT